MGCMIRSIGLEKLIAHRDNPNRMSRANYKKLMRNIERGGRYEPLVVRPIEEKEGCFEIINGHHRAKALDELGFETADCIVWDIDDEQAEIYLATLNRLVGRDDIIKKIALLKRLSRKCQPVELARILPDSRVQIEKLCRLKRPCGPGKIKVKNFASAMVFFVNDGQKEIIEKALELALGSCGEGEKAVRRAAALTQIAKKFQFGDE